MVEMPSLDADDFYAGMAGLNGTLAYGHAIADYGQFAGIDLALPLAAFSGGVAAITAGAAVNGSYPGRLLDPARWGRDAAIDAYIDHGFEQEVADRVSARSADDIEQLFEDQLPVRLRLFATNSTVMGAATDRVLNAFAHHPIAVRRDLDAYIDQALIDAYIADDAPLQDVWGVDTVTLDMDAFDEDRIEDAYADVFDDLAAVDDYLERRGTDRIDRARDELRSVILDRTYPADRDLSGDTLDDLYTEAVERAVPGFVQNDAVHHLYDGDDIHPSTIHRSLLADFADFLAAYDSPVAADLRDTLDDDLGREGLRQIEQDLLQEADILPTRLTGEKRNAFLELRDGTNANVLNRYRPDTAITALEENWGTADMPYDIYEIDDPDALYTAAKEVGTCRREERHRDYYDNIAADPGTVVLGVHRHDEDRWLGFSRNYLLEAPAERADVLGIDALEMVYAEGSKGGNPHGACDFEEYGDVPIVLGLAGMRYALDHDMDYVVVGSSEGRVSGGPDDQYVDQAVGPGHMYKGTSATTRWLQKDEPVPDGVGISGSPGYGFSLELRGGDWVFPDKKKEHDFLMEPIRMEPPR